MSVAEEKWKWIDFLGAEMEAGASERRVLLTWSASSVAVAAILLWTMLGVADGMAIASPLAALAVLAALAYVVVSLVDSLFPGGLDGLVSTILGDEYDSEHPLDVLLEIIRTNLGRIRRRVALQAVGNLLPTALLVWIAFDTGPYPLSASFGLGLLITLRIVWITFEAVLLYAFLTEKWITTMATLAKQAEEDQESSPQVQKLVNKVAFVLTAGSLTVKGAFNLLQVAVCIALAGYMLGASSNALRLILLAPTIPFLLALAWSFWRTARKGALTLAHLGDLRSGILLGHTPPGKILEALKETMKTVAEDRAFPYVLPASVLEGIGRDETKTQIT